MHASILGSEIFIVYRTHYMPNICKIFSGFCVWEDFASFRLKYVEKLTHCALLSLVSFTHLAYVKVNHLFVYNGLISSLILGTLFLAPV